MLGKFLAHQHQILAESIFVRNYLDARPLAYSLVRFQLGQGLRLYRQIIPKYIKLVGTDRQGRDVLGYWCGAVGLAPRLLELLTALAHHIVLRVVHVMVVAVETRVSTPIDEANVAGSLDDHIVVRAMRAHDKLVLGVPPFARMPRQCSFLLRFPLLVCGSERRRHLAAVIHDLDLRRRQAHGLDVAIRRPTLRP